MSLTTDFSLTSPGKEVNLAVGVSLPAGDSIDLENTTVTSMNPSKVTVSGALVNSVPVTVANTQKTYQPGHALLFTAEAATGITIKVPPEKVAVKLDVRSVQGRRRVLWKDIYLIKDVVP